MNVSIHHIETLVPENSYAQDYVCERMLPWAPDQSTARRLRAAFRRSGIRTRHSVLPDFAPGAQAQLFGQDDRGQILEPTTEARNRRYAEAATALGVALARQTIAGTPGLSPLDITHLITVSCTGFYNPGLDCQLVRHLGFSGAVQRYHLGFMGCYAAFPALRMAQQFCQAQPGAVVLVVCLELCTLHMQVQLNADTILANALFGDGAAAAIVSAQPPSPDRPVLVLDQFVSALAPEGHGDMAWDIGNAGFNLVLSSYVPDIIGANIRSIIQPLLNRETRCPNGVDFWAVHPGGKAILDKIQASLELRPEQLEASRYILHHYGNLSSATVLFVLRRLLDANGRNPATVCAMAFGPGLVIETALLGLTPALAASTPAKSPLPAPALLA